MGDTIRRSLDFIFSFELCRPVFEFVPKSKRERKVVFVLGMVYLARYACLITMFLTLHISEYSWGDSSHPLGCVASAGCPQGF
jgi:hypothetical protein